MTNLMELELELFGIDSTLKRELQMSRLVMLSNVNKATRQLATDETSSGFVVQ